MRLDGRPPPSRAWLLDQLATAPLVFPSIVMGVAFLNVFVNLPFGIYGALASVIIALAVGYLPYGMRNAYAGVDQAAAKRVGRDHDLRHP